MKTKKPQKKTKKKYSADRKTVHGTFSSLNAKIPQGRPKKTTYKERQDIRRAKYAHKKRGKGKLRVETQLKLSKRKKKERSIAPNTPGVEFTKDGRVKGFKNILSTNFKNELMKVEQATGKSFLQHFIEQAYLDNTVAVALAKKLLPDLSSVYGGDKKALIAIKGKGTDELIIAIDQRLSGHDEGEHTVQSEVTQCVQQG